MNKKEKRIYLNPDIFYLEKANYYFDIIRQLVDLRFVIHLKRPLTTTEESMFNVELNYYQVSDCYPKDKTYIPWEGVQRVCQIEPDDKEFLNSNLQKQLDLYVKHNI